MFLMDIINLTRFWKEDEKMKNFYEPISSVNVLEDAAGRFGYSKKLSKYYLTCISYVSDENKGLLKSTLNKSEDLLTEDEKQVILNEQNRQNVQSIFERVCLNQARDEDQEFAEEFIKAYSLEDLVKALIPKEFDNVYTFANRCSSLEVNELIKSLRSTLGNNDKSGVIAAYLGYCMDDKKIKEDMSRLQTKAGTLRLKISH